MKPFALHCYDVVLTDLQKKIIAINFIIFPFTKTKFHRKIGLYIYYDKMFFQTLYGEAAISFLVVIKVQCKGWMMFRSTSITANLP